MFGDHWRPYPEHDLENAQRHALVAILEHGLQTLFAAHVADAASRLELPEDYRSFLLADGRSFHTRRGNGMNLYDAAGALAATQREIALFATERETDVLWLTIADWSDKHTKLLCCDRTSPSFGAVLECHDDHPWWSGASSELEFASFSQFLADIERSYW